MWLLSTDRAELREFPSPESVPRGYAILSHVWNKGPGAPEQSFQDVQAIRSKCIRRRENPRDFVSEKIRQSCILAARDGYQWIWNDTCCIEKTSSSALSEAINSMYRYYSSAEICYAYLADVPSFENPTDRHSSFRRSEWHTRGWTLQELLAPALVLFVSRDWRPLSTKARLANVISEITSIPARILTLEQRIEDASVAQRMAWAAGRQTKYSEDRAYSLMGIFDVNMPTMYGEGPRAFQRLQEEIMRRSADTSLFAWGLRRWEYVEMPDQTRLNSELALEFRGGGSSSLFAESPSDFSRPTETALFCPSKPMRIGRHVVYKPNKPPTIFLTPHGALARVPIINEGNSGRLIAVLFCTSNDRPLGLVLKKCEGPTSPIGPLYRVNEVRLVHLDDLPHEYRDNTSACTPVWRDVYISLSKPVALTYMVINRSREYPFHVPSSTLAVLRSKGFKVTQLPIPNSPDPLPLEWAGCPAFVFECRSSPSNVFVVRLGRCCPLRGEHSTDTACRPGQPWAAVVGVGWEPDNTKNAGAHACATDHINRWVGGRKTFAASVITVDPFTGYGDLMVTLSFDKAPWNGDTLILHLEIGEVVQTMIFADDPQDDVL